MTGSSAAAEPAVLNGRYALGRLIGEGGMAQVFRGHDRRLDRPVAVKVLRAHYAAAAEFLARFQREARLAASLTHPHLVKVFDVGQDGHRHYIVMELLPGGTLADLADGAPLPFRAAIDLALQVALGMAVAHRRGLVHRDLKPQNILIAEDGGAKVGDFGLARAGDTTHLTEPGTIWGTVQYLSPEQAQGLPADARSDVYALGAICFELLTGSPPYAAPTPAATMLQHIYAPPPLLRDSNSSLPAEAERVVAQAMAKSPDERFQSMDDLAQALRDLRAIASAPTVVWPAVPPGAAPGGRGAAAGPEGQTPPIRWRAPGLVAPAALALCALLAAGVVLVRLANPPVPQTQAQPAATPAPGAASSVPPAVPVVLVPDVVGDPVATAQEKVAAAGLTVETTGAVSSDLPAGRVAAQDPPASTRLEQGATVKLTVTRAPQQATPPAPLRLGAYARFGGFSLTVARYEWSTTCGRGGRLAPGTKFVALRVTGRNDTTAALAAPAVRWTLAGHPASAGAERPCAPEGQAFDGACAPAGPLAAGARCEGWVVFEVPQALQVPGAIVQAHLLGGSAPDAPDAASWRL